MQLLRRYDLVESLADQPEDVLQQLCLQCEKEPSAEKLYSYAELSYLLGRRAEERDPAEALDYYGGSVAHSYLYLFDERFADLRNPYDPQFRGACDLYNGALESCLRIVQRQGQLKLGDTHTVETSRQAFDVTVVRRDGAFPNVDFERFEFVSDFEVQGLKNQYQSFGLGVPLIGVRKARTSDVAEKFYPVNASVPVTAFLRVMPDEVVAGQSPTGHRRCQLELFDPLNTQDITVGARRVPLESDLSTPLAYFLSQEEFSSLATFGLIRPDLFLQASADTRTLTGLYMVQPYEPGKIPVIMVHGLWSSPITWLQMFNDLRSQPELQARYQFWFYLYPTGQPFWNSAAMFRRDLADMRQTVDPKGQEPSLDQMVLVGHSMGGLVSRLQTIDSGEEYWHIVSDHPFSEVQGSPEDLEAIRQVFFFEPNPSVRRVITIATPHRGSEFANDTTRFVARKLIYLPKMMTERRAVLVRDNPGLIRDPHLLQVSTSIDSLAPSSPILPVMLRSTPPRWIRYNNIVGVLPEKGLVGTLAGGSDGVVAYESAHLELAESELVVNADHTRVHQHPLSVLEVRRILLDHLNELENFTDRERFITLTRNPTELEVPQADSDVQFR